MKTLHAAALAVLLATCAQAQALAPKPKPDPGKKATPKPPVAPTPIVRTIVGPVVGHVEETAATLWLRARILGSRRGSIVTLIVFEQRIPLDFLIYITGEFEIGELQQLDRLLQLRRHHKGLSLAQVQPL